MRRFTEIWFGLAIGLMAASLRIAGCAPIEQLELRLLDQRLRLREKGPASPDVVIVAIDNRSLQEYGRWPWPRPLMADLIERVNAAGPAVIGIDVVQSEASPECRVDGAEKDLDPSCRGVLERVLASGRAGDQRLADVVRQSERTVLGYFFERRIAAGGPSKAEGAPSSPGGIPEAELDQGAMENEEDAKTAPRLEREGVYPIVHSTTTGQGERRVRSANEIVRNLPELTVAARALGYFTFFPDIDGLYRRAPLAIRFGDQMATPLALSMLAVRWPGRSLSIRFGEFGVESLRFGNSEIPVAEDGQLLVNYRGPRETFKHISAADILGGRVSGAELRDRFVLIGVTAKAVEDLRATPVDPVFPGVEIHANVLDNILREDFVYQAAWRGLSWTSFAEAVMILVGALTLAALLRFARGVRGALLAGMLLFLYFGASQMLFDSTGTALRLVFPILAFTLTYVAVGVQHYVAAERETRETRRVLDLYLSPSLSRELSAHPEMLKLGGEKSERTVLFSDVKEFTSFSERLDPVELVELLNFYLGEMTDVVFHYDGMLDKYIGDGVMAVWGAPIPQADHAARACHAALAMKEALRRVNDFGGQRGWPVLEMRIGLNSGQMVFGNMGSTRHLSLTVMGDNVNLGARLEGINKLYGSAIIASETTVTASGGGFVTRELDRVRVKGKTQVVRIYELLGTAAEQEGWADLLRHFDAGLAAYRDRRWDEAAAAFAAAMQAHPEDGPADLYLRRCQQFRQNPPPDNWEAVTRFGE